MVIRPAAGISLCSGIAGLDLGLHRALGGKYVTRCYVEGEAFAAATLVARMEDKRICSAPIWSNVKTFDGKAWRGKVDCITAGYPCQPFSFAGKRKGEQDSRHLWPAIASIVRDVQPRWVFCENVPGHINLGLAQVCQDLEGMGYRVEAGLFSAQECGAPHIRQRLFILAYTHIFNSICKQCSGGQSMDWANDRLHAVREKNAGGIAGCGEAVADANSKGQLQQTNFVCEKRGRPCDSCQDVADAQRGAKWPHAQGVDANGQRVPKARSQQTAPFECGGADVANADCARRAQRSCEPSISRQQQGGVQQSERQSTCGNRQQEPTVRRMGRATDGLSERMDGPWKDGWEAGTARVTSFEANRADRLRALGNAVVPSTAQLAFATLYRRFSGLS